MSQEEHKNEKISFKYLYFLNRRFHNQNLHWFLLFERLAGLIITDAFLVFFVVYPRGSQTRDAGLEFQLQTSDHPYPDFIA